MRHRQSSGGPTAVAIPRNSARVLAEAASLVEEFYPAIPHHISQRVDLLLCLADKLAAEGC